mmetsp:Transcript_4947/g.14342  ORF Transcript_4947/g.14342 Transcript_4947/m.14342 type:complete len:194 (+) Transcript_4947:328-909(+)
MITIKIIMAANESNPALPSCTTSLSWVGVWDKFLTESAPKLSCRKPRRTFCLVAMVMTMVMTTMMTMVVMMVKLITAIIMMESVSISHRDTNHQHLERFTVRFRRGDAVGAVGQNVDQGSRHPAVPLSPGSMAVAIAVVIAIIIAVVLVLVLAVFVLAVSVAVAAHEKLAGTLQDVKEFVHATVVVQFHGLAR